MKLTANSDLSALLYAVSLQGRFFNTESSRRLRAAENEFERTAVISRLIKGVNTEFAERAKREIEQAREEGVEIISVADTQYPPNLLELSDPPLVLFVRGELATDFCFGIVGTRKCTSYGRRAAKTIARKLSERGASIISGLARGIDTAAHCGAIEAAQSMGVYPGVAVLGSGLSHIYPAENRGLARALLENGGAIISEFGLEQTPRKDLFPRRNRIISGLARGVLVVEAAKKSGSLITARLALEQGRDVFALPGPIDSEVSAGSNNLLKSGAQLLDSIDELLEQYPELVLKEEEDGNASDETETPSALSAPARRVMEGLKSCSRANIDEISQLADINTRELLPLLTRLELEGKLELGPDQRYELSSLIDS